MKRLKCFCVCVDVSLPPAVSRVDRERTIKQDREVKVVYLLFVFNKRSDEREELILNI